MKTTLILNNHLVRRAKSQAAFQGLTLSRYMEKCLEMDLARSKQERVGDWICSLPKTPAKATEEVDAILAAGGFEDIDAAMWR